MANRFDWVPFYKEFAVKLLSFKSNRTELIVKVKQIFVLSGIDMPKLEVDNNIVDIDPFTVFGFFNKKLTDNNRNAILLAISQLFEVNSPLPESFDGIPVLNPLNAAFYYFSDKKDKRKETDIENLWDLFEAALDYSKDSSEQNRDIFASCFTKALEIGVIGNAKITMGLYWIAPETYLNLDSRNILFIYESKKFPESLIQKLPPKTKKLTGPVYLNFIQLMKNYLADESTPFSNFMELSYAAWLESTEENNGLTSRRYWLYSPGDNANRWDEFFDKGIMAIGWQGMGDLSLYSNLGEMRTKMKELHFSDTSQKNNALATWEFSHDMKPGDVVYAKKGLGELVGRGIVVSSYVFDGSVNDYGHIREVCWTHNGEWKNNVKHVQKALTEITNKNEYKKLESLFGEDVFEEIEDSDPELITDEWSPSLEEYSTGITKADWLNLLNNKNIIGPVWGGALAAFYGMGGAATCSQVGKKYNRSPYGISGNCSNLARNIYKLTNCPITIRDNGQKRYWPILFQGKKAGPGIEGAFIWRLRPELYDALTEFGIMRYEWKKEEKQEKDSDKSYWWLNANPKIWSFADIAVGEEQSYTFYNENGNKRKVFQNFLNAKEGDLIVGYESTPVRQIVALAKISKIKEGEELFFKKTESLSIPIDISELKESPELAGMEYFQNPQGSLFKLTHGEYETIMDMIREVNPVQKQEAIHVYTKDNFLKEVYMKEDSYLKMVTVLKNKKNIILQGAPGVGKTFAAMRLAYSMIGEIDDDRIQFIQFHQNYSYEDFVIGYKPIEDGFSLKKGIFYHFCQKASEQPDKDYFFIIDEINRGNMSKIFGELLMLIEKDYRGKEIKLAYDGLPFSVPKNLYIIGMMNTADRSLAMIDYALRRRFSFFDMEPGFDSKQFVEYQKRLNNKKLDELIIRVKELNAEIESDKSLGKGFCIGHSYFCGQEKCTEEWLYSIVNYDILPMLREYWFDDDAKVQKWEGILRGVLS